MEYFLVQTVAPNPHYALSCRKHYFLVKSIDNIYRVIIPFGGIYD